MGEPHSEARRSIRENESRKAISQTQLKSRLNSVFQRSDQKPAQVASARTSGPQLLQALPSAGNDVFGAAAA
jgi:hypothetical protein